ncbi:hypothetical protein GCM10023148_36600 [Actinokineospora soli]
MASATTALSRYGHGPPALGSGAGGAFATGFAVVVTCVDVGCGAGSGVGLAVQAAAAIKGSTRMARFMAGPVNQIHSNVICATR